MKRFWDKVIIKEEDDCWIWKASVNSGCYGQFKFRGDMIQAHRFAYYLANNTINMKLLVMHKCDNKLCMNPKHLIQGTAKDNTHDMIVKGRHGRGAKRKLNIECIKVIRWYLKYKYSYHIVSRLAKAYNISVKNISCIKEGKIWKGIEV
jgi:hypothetical protein